MSYFGPNGTPLDDDDDEEEWERDARITGLVDNHESIIDEVRGELRRSIEKFGVQNHDPMTWLAILGEEYGEACQAAVQAAHEPGKHTWSDHRKELIQTACVAIKSVEAYDRAQNKEGKS